MTDEPAPTATATVAECALAVPVERLRWRCDPSALPFRSTAQMPAGGEVVGQDRAIEALAFGLETSAPGQNVFVRGLPGTGRMTLVRQMLAEVRPCGAPAPDRCLVHGFQSPEQPRALTLPRGRGEAFRQRIDDLVDFVVGELPKVLSSEHVRARRAALEESAQAELHAITAPFDQELRENAMALTMVSAGEAQRPMILPLVDGEPTPPAEIARLQAAGTIAADDVARMRERAAHYQRALETVNLKTQDVHTRHREAVRALFQDEVEATLDRECDRVRREFDGADVARFLADLVADVRQHHAAIAAEPALARRYRVNLLSAHREDEPCPVVVENAPSARNLLGGIDRPLAPGDPPLADHLMIHAGALLRADGGFLLLDAREVLAEPGAWRALMRTLRNGQLEITPPQQGPNGGAVLTPEPIPVRVKVVLIGEPDVHAALDSADPDFPQLFKVLADFDSTMPSDTQGVTMYASVLARLADAEGLSHFDATAVAAIAEHGARIASRQDRLTTRFGRLADIAREAAFVAGKAGAELVGAEHVREAVRRTRRRTDLPARRFSERIAEGVIRIQTRGSTVGQINGLAVTHAGPLTYGFPARITATIGPGTAGTINIEREANLSGAIHTKGFYILGGLLRHLLRTDHPLAFSASIAFEQSYGGIDGDSASGAEACCLLSALTGVAIRQDRAMTGAIDQHGHIQPVGAVTEKVEGFFDVCRDAGLTGTQGVLLPRANVRDLMLRPDVVEACAAGRFHVWAVETVHEALAVLTGCPAGERGADGAYPTGTLLALAEARAGAYWEQATAGLRLAGLAVSP